MKNNLQPKLRFKNYEGDWNFRKLGELGSVEMCKRIFKQQTTIQGDIPFYKIGTFGRKPDAFINQELFEEFKFKYPYPEMGDILISASGTIGRTVIYNGENAYYQDSNIVWLKRDKDKIDNSFLYQFYQIAKWAGTEGSTIKRLYNSNILNTDIYLPVLEEQIKIGTFLKQLDETIAFHQQELETLKQTKQGFLQKMFPREGKAVPEIRFSGFTQEWKIEKLKNLADFSKGNGYSKKDLVEDGTPILLYGQLYTNYKTEIRTSSSFVLEKENSKISSGNEVVVPASGETSNDIARASAITKSGIIIGGDLNVIVPISDIDPIFLALALSNGRVQKELSKLAQGKSVVHLQNSEIKKVELLFPGLIEQQKIAEFFSQIDQTIELHEKELEALKETKKAFLQKMFV